MQSNQYSETQGQFSPSAAGAPRWIAYSSDETGRFEVYVRSFPAGSDRVRVSSDGGAQPRWRSDGRELYYIAPDRKLMEVEVTMAPKFEYGVPKPLFETPITNSEAGARMAMQWAPAPDAKQFLFLAAAEQAASAPITVVLNWPAAMKR